MENSQTLDVAIVGAGPAGAASALALAGRGLCVGILEKGVPPRHKTCGGGVLRRAARLLPIDISATVERECFAAELVHHAPALRFVCRREQPIISMVMRDRFDHALGRAAEEGGARFFSGTTVHDVQLADGHVQLLTSAGDFSARFVIAADGVNSIVARQTRRPPLRDVIPALECEVRVAPESMAAFAGAARFDFGFVPAGYAWVFPKREHLSIGVLTTRRGAASLPEYYRRYLTMLGIPPPLREERHGYMIPSRPRAGLWGVPRVLFVGDAAGLADPLTAEGITAAISSGQLAARAILAGEFKDTLVQRIYRRSLSKTLLAEHRMARWIARAVYNYPTLRHGLLRRRGQNFSELLTQIVTGENSYRSILLQPKNYWRFLWKRHVEKAAPGR
ncbi:MAG: NAD(P)/FAD-dependent oxidoreductase [Opitutaceae bacterium]